MTQEAQPESFDLPAGEDAAEIIEVEAGPGGITVKVDDPQGLEIVAVCVGVLLGVFVLALVGIARTTRNR